ncbi:unnamed protein product [Symbiodinium microadriaticum]|nr:unnamed protein product [Symbiodinium microadriaticum]CAE7887656.1 unnamed protein product [Symbiodinium sp. KB8]
MLRTSMFAALCVLMLFLLILWKMLVQCCCWDKDHAAENAEIEEQRELVRQQRATGHVAMSRLSWIVAVFWICIDAFFFMLDMILDVNTIKALLNGEHFLFAGFLVAIVLRSFLQRLLSGELLALPSAVFQSCRRGIRHEAFLEILREERGFEAPASLALTYSLVWCVTDAPTST